MKPHSFALALALTGSVLPACKGKQKAPAPAPSASAAKPALPPRVDAALLQELNDIASKCKVDAAAGNVTCDKGENRRLSNEFLNGKRSRPAAIATLAMAIADKNGALQTAAATLLNGAFRVPWGDDAKVGSVEAEDAKSLVAAAVKLPNALARQAVPGAVHAAMLSGSTTETYALIDTADAAEIRPLGYRYVMTHGRLAAFPKVQELVQDKSVTIAFAALEAPRNMYRWTEDEKATVCPWAAGLLSDARSNLATRAATLLANCSGEFVDQLLERGEKSLKAGQFNAAELGPFRDLCSPAARRLPGGASDEQCDRNRKLLSDAIANKKLEGQTRALSLVAVAYQWPDDKTLKLAQSLEKNADKALAERAAGIVKRLQERKATNKDAQPRQPALPATPAP